MNETVHTPSRRGRGAKAATAGDVETATAAPAGTGRTNDPDRTIADILDVATAEFAAKGLAGGRIDEIAAATRTSKRMIYYYFGSKEGLYVAVLEEAYRRVRQIESEQHLEDLPPTEAMEKLVAFTVDHHWSHEPFIRLVMNENIHRGEYLAKSTHIAELNRSAIQAVSDIYRRGVEAGDFRPGLDPVDVHMSISALCFFNVSNQHTFGLIFDRDLTDPRAREVRRATIVEMVMRYLKP